MGNIPGLPTPPAGFLWWAGWYIQSTAEKFNDLSEDIRSVYVIGIWLSYPFYVVGSFLDNVANKLYQADDVLQLTSKWVDGLINGNTFVDLLRWASVDLSMIRGNAINWLKGKLSLINTAYATLSANPLSFVNIYLRLIKYWIPSFLDNTQSWIYTHLANISFDLILFISSPFNFILAKVRLISPELTGIIDNALGYIRNKLYSLIYDGYNFIHSAQVWVYNRLAAQVPFFAMFFSNPQAYVKAWVSTWFGVPVNFWVDPWGYTTGYVINILHDRIQLYTGILKNIAVYVILHFM